MIYMDYNATTPVRPEVLDAMLPFYRERFGNPSSIHRAGRDAKRAVEEARERVARLVNCDPAEVVFTSSGTEADNMAIKGVAEALRGRGNHIITTTVEHPAVSNACSYLEQAGFEVTRVDVGRTGLVDPEAIEAAITPQTILISVMFANNETGTLMPVAQLGEIASRRRIYLHSDAVQAVGRLPVDVREMNIQLLSLSGHKLHAPKGTGALVVRKGVKVVPFIHGGAQERNRRAGTENVAGAVAFGKACELACDEMMQEARRLALLRDRLEEGILTRVPGAQINGSRGRRLPNTLSVSFEGVAADSLLMSLDLEGVAVSSGAACSSGTLRSSAVLAAMGIPPEIARGSIRFSLGLYNCDEDVTRVLDLLPHLVERLRS
ncbi:cysteine desulfurase NifS [Geobacter sp. DSM 9736]|uniref:cysteine desulfurase NifS n=1 Tax=Geobacter sp. DSM 9736 TaxID=1277350 RepID=UPI000B507010|nr:cysteine desulfurase [Geobacter sp. DSM 9736]